jgi:branched-chain amino acid aminotransferase
MQEVCQAIEEGRMLEMFGSGTAAVISPIKRIHYAGKDWMIPLDPADPKSQAGPLARRLWEAITTIQYGEVDHPWSYRAE